MPPEWKESFRYQLMRILERNPKYVWGGAESEEKGLDCSGYLYLAAKWARIPGLTRTTAIEMARGSGGWTGIDILPDELFSNVDECDLPFWTWQDKPWRPYGHLGVFLIGENGLLQVTHASLKRGVVLVPFEGVFQRDLAKIRRLTIGDKK